MGSKKGKSNIAIAILEEFTIWTYPISPFKRNSIPGITKKIRTRFSKKLGSLEKLNLRFDLLLYYYISLGLYF